VRLSCYLDWENLTFGTVLSKRSRPSDVPHHFPNALRGFPGPGGTLASSRSDPGCSATSVSANPAVRINYGSCSIDANYMPPENAIR
jgi:hypothetical protein